MREVREMHQYDQNFSADTLDRINELLDNPEVREHPELYQDLIYTMKLEALLVTENSPYAEVRAVVDNWDDVTMPSLTFRVWTIGIIFAGAGAFINQLFSVRMPSVYVTSNVAQLLAWPAGKLLEKTLPSGKLNPGPFNKKEHMLITIMATVAFNTPYTGYIVLTQALPMFFDQAYAKNWGYQILNTLGSNFVGYGLAGLCRRFIVYPSFCVWPSSLTALAINKAFHSDDSTAVPGPFRKMYSWSRMKLFLFAFVSMFIYWWFPGFIFMALGQFNWLSWIDKSNETLNSVSGIYGLGVNPIMTFDFNTLMFNGWTPLVIPFFSVFNQFLGMILFTIMAAAFYWTNTLHTGYLPINTNKVRDNTGKNFNVTRILDDRGIFDYDKYQQYSEAHLSAGSLVSYFWFFAAYTAAISYAILYHRHELAHSFKSFWRSIRRSFRRTKTEAEEEDELKENLAEDIHWRLMKAYREVPEWWYFIILCLALVLGMVGVGVYPTNTTPAVVIYGVIMALIFVVPLGLITAVTGLQVTLNVLAEFIGGAMVPGQALAMNYFKMYGYITTAQALYFSSDLKLAHYTKIAPRHTFIAQVVATLVSTFVCTSLFNFQMSFRDVCTPKAAFHFSCPGEHTFFTAAVFWGTIGPKRLFGNNGNYRYLLIGFPVGLLLPVLTFFAQKKFPRQRWLRQLHPVMITIGGLSGAPYNIGYIWPSVWLTWLSWIYIRKRYLEFWSRYNYVLAAAWSAAIAIAAIVIFFGINIPEVELNWWGNNADADSCDGVCTRLEIPAKGYFGPDPGNFK